MEIFERWVQLTVPLKEDIYFVEEGFSSMAWAFP